MYRFLLKPANRPVCFVRCQSNVPQFNKKGNLVLSALKYVKEVDQFQEKIDKETPEQQLARKLIDNIKSRKELLSLLSLFHEELAQIGITPHTSHQEQKPSVGLKWKYRIAYMMKLARIHNTFWDSCQQEGISQRNHRLGFSPQTIGVLDPVHYKEHYDELQQGKLGDVDFRDVEVLGKRFIIK
ncbi:hypothetical protein CJI97_005380 [Candidozyma auris]|uniref:Uncharacterized protein n=1 Tax=Candidozyma auris TaxID=498019 RepID=A0A2H0ZD89_CANAR|nr:hypothetical_protein [[Candida] auris]PIS48598.1 hypothetical protein B9J08_005296 [[Candida] auris]PIS49211.1 hypothetical protein CJI97_005380 [[Candida] auris]QEO23189.1 hypothetical_protein [[Candida] auris]GBL49236.1 hypothetical protein CAJCM15448_15100 [[Candida] auris]